MKQFLTRLAEWSDDTPLPCASARVMLRLVNRSDKGDDGVPTMSRYRYGKSVAKLRDLVEMIRHKHPQIGLRVEVKWPAYDDDHRIFAFECVEEMSFYTKDAAVSRRWTARPHDADVFEDYNGDVDAAEEEDGELQDEPYDPKDASDTEIKKLLLPAVPQLPDLYYNTDRVVEERPEDTTALVNVVLEAVGIWQAHGTDLQELRLPIAFSSWGLDHAPSATAYVNYLATTCPGIEQISGYYELHRRVEQWGCSEQWFINEATWETFCAATTKLKTFDWVVVSFATRFFETFGQYAKPQLETLTLSTAMDWNWENYYSAWGIPIDPHCYGETAQNARAVLKARANLRELVIPLYAYTDVPSELETDCVLEHLSLSGQRQHRREKVTSRQPMVDQEIFGDPFCQALARDCPRLERLTIYRIIRMFGDQFPIMGITDTALRALATMPRLVSLELQAVNVTAAGIFALATGFTQSDWTQQRDFQLMVVEYTDLTFYETIEHFLTLLAEWEDGVALLCASQQVVLTVHNGRIMEVDAEWSRMYLTRLRSLVMVVQRKHPTMRLCLRLYGYDDQAPSFAMILEFAFYSADAELSNDYEWANDDENDRIDDVFVAMMD